MLCSTEDNNYYYYTMEEDYFRQEKMTYPLIYLAKRGEDTLYFHQAMWHKYKEELFRDIVK